MSGLDLIIEYAERVGELSVTKIDAARAELAQLRARAAELDAARDKIAWLTTTIGEDGLAAINRLIAACERGDINQIAAPDLSIARDEILEARTAIEQARPFVELAEQELWFRSKPKEYADAGAWLAAHPAPQAEQEQPS